jgi:hydroxyethylthiazole kinase
MVHDKSRFSAVYNKIKTQQPLVVCLTNFVTVNDVANALLACGAQPVMSVEPGDTRDLLGHASALYINMGTPDHTFAHTALAAAETAYRKSLPVVFDPVGCGAGALRTHIARELYASGFLTAVKGNLAEIKALLGRQSAIRGVDSLEQEQGDSDKEFLKAGAVPLTVVSGRHDLVITPEKSCFLAHGHPRMKQLSGTGCVMGALTAAALAVMKDDPLTAGLAAVLLMGMAGEQAARTARGPLSFKTLLIDGMSDADSLLAATPAIKGGAY